MLLFATMIALRLLMASLCYTSFYGNLSFDFTYQVCKGVQVKVRTENGGHALKTFSVCLATIVGTIGQVLAFGFVPTARSAYIKPLFIDLLRRMALLGILAPKRFGLMIGITGVVCSCRLCLPSFQIHQLALNKIGGTSSSCYLHMPTRAIVCFP